MLKNYFIVAFRGLLRNGSISLINILGLSVSMLSCILIYLAIEEELSYDRHHEHAQSIFRVESSHVANGEERRWAATQSALLPYLLENAPEVQAGVRINKSGPGLILRYEDRRFREDRFIYADSSVFDVFTLPLAYGDPATALNAPWSLVLTPEMATKYFGEQNPIGKTLTTPNNNTFTVTGVIRSLPPQSHFHFDFIASITTYNALIGTGWVNWSISDFYTYVRLNNPEATRSLEARLPALVDTLLGGGENTHQLAFRLKPLTDIHLHSDVEKEFQANGNIAYIYILGAIALFLPLIAAINYMNLTTARALRRSREVGVRKVVGAGRGQLTLQFLGESLLFCCLAMAFTLVALWAITPYFNELAGAHISLSRIFALQTLAALLGFTFVVGILAGLYPALFLSAFRPVTMLKTTSGGQMRGSMPLLLRRALVVFQFTVSIFLFIGAGVLYTQMDYVHNKSLGFDKEQVVVLNLPGRTEAQSIPTLKEELLKLSDVIAATASLQVPGERIYFLGGSYEGQTQDQSLSQRTLSVDADFIKTMDMRIVAGRDFMAESTVDAQEGFIVNEAFVRAAGWERPIGKRYEYNYRLDTPKVGRVIGVVEDFHYASLHTAVEPLALHIWPWYGKLSVRVQPGDIRQTLADIATIWDEVFPFAPLDYTFLDASFDRLYHRETMLTNVLTIFTSLAVVIACLGLFGLSAYSAERRTREIAIRKTLGATISGILYLLASEYIVLIALANIIAWPLAYYGAESWLQNFAYRAPIPWALFPLAAAGSLAIALLSVGFRSTRAALANPVDSLKYE